VRGLDPGETADVSIVDLSTISRYTTSKTTGTDGNTEFWLRKGDLYQVNIAKKGYTMYNQTTALGVKDLAVSKMQNTNGQQVDMSNVSITSDETINLDGSVTIHAEIKKMAEGVKMELQNINFETNSSTLNPSSYEQLDMLVDNLKMNSDIKIELSAHTDDVGADAYNFKLSDQRAAAVAEYLIAKGIAKSRIISKGYGKTQPLVPNTSDENRAKNRRVELKVISTDNK